MFWILHRFISRAAVLGWVRALAWTTGALAMGSAARAVELEIGVAPQTAMHSVEYLEFSANEQTMATSHWKNTIHLWDTNTFRVRASVSVREAGHRYFVLSPDGRTLAVAEGASGSEVLFHDTSSGRKKGTWQVPQGDSGERRQIAELAYRDDGTLAILAGGWRDGLKHSSYVFMLTPDGAHTEQKLPVLASSLEAVLDRGQWIADIAGYESSPKEAVIRLSPTGEIVAQTSGFSIQSFAAGKRRAVFVGTGGPAPLQAFNYAQGRLVALAAWGGQRKLNVGHFVGDGRYLHLHEVKGTEQSPVVTDFLYDTEGGRLHALPRDIHDVDVRGTLVSYVTCSDGNKPSCRAEVVDLASSRKAASFTVEPEGNYSIWLSPSGKYAVVSSNDMGGTTMKVWSVPTNRQAGPN